MQDALNENGEEEDANLTPEEKAKRDSAVNEVKDKAREEARTARVDMLVKNLTHKLSIYTDGPCDYNAAKAYQEMIRLEAEDLKVENYGVELLHAIGFTYTLKAKQYLGKNEMLGLGSWFHGVREKGHILSETVSTLRAAMDLQQSFTQLQEAEKVEMDEAAKKVLEEAAASKGIRALWKGSKLEVEGKKRRIRGGCEQTKKRKKKSSRDDENKKHVIDGMMLTLTHTFLFCSSMRIYVVKVSFVRCATSA